MLKSVAITASLSLFLVFSTGCDESAGCDDCGGTLDEGYLFDHVSTENMQNLIIINGIEIGACIRVKMDGSEFDLDNVAVVDDCCCETLGY